MSVNESFYDKKVAATQTDPDLALRLMLMTEFHGVLCFDIGVICRLSSVLGHYLQMDNFGVL